VAPSTKDVLEASSGLIPNDAATWLYIPEDGSRFNNPSEYYCYFTLFISVHMINTAKQSQFMHNISVYLLTFVF
jgi:hypothetical protein